MKLKLKAIQRIGDEICEGCNQNRDCGLEYDECSRIQSAMDILDGYINCVMERREDDDF